MGKDFECSVITIGNGGGLVPSFTAKVSAQGITEAEDEFKKIIERNPFAKGKFLSEGARVECRQLDLDA